MCKGEKDNDTHKTSAHPETTPETTDQRIQEKQKKQSKYQRDIDDDDDNHTLLPENNMHLRKCPRLDYNQLNKPIFPDKIGDKQLASGETTYATYDASFGGDEPKTLQEAKEIPEWPQLESAIKSKLNQLTKMGTWELVEHPKEIIPIANKCVFQKKYNQIGKIMKYKGRLVAKGCAQHPGFDYNETYSPVIQLEMIRAILALVPIYNLKINQMDIKGTYLNRYLYEQVYMKQPEGYENKTGHICHLKKTLYGLKTSQMQMA